MPLEAWPGTMASELEGFSPGKRSAAERDRERQRERAQRDRERERETERE